MLLNLFDRAPPSIINMVLMVDVIDFTGSAPFIVLGLLSHSSHTFYILGATVVGGKGGLYAIAFTHA